jgi:hypothetical protein
MLAVIKDKADEVELSRRIAELEHNIQAGCYSFLDVWELEELKVRQQTALRVIEGKGERIRRILCPM